MNESEPFASYVGQEVVLLRSQKIWEIYSKYEYHFVKYSMRPMGTSHSDGYGHIVMEVAEGTKIRIEDVKEISDSTGSMIYAVCSLEKSDGTLFNFEYNWGGLSRVDIAPWEPIEVGRGRTYEPK
tara:strand:- start:39 stop:413 length:375 start_codon:yes stop_codon:yes gene_type:complete